METPSRNDQLFQGLVFQYQQMTMMALGKISRPEGGIQANLEEAALYIDLLAMIEEKTRGNLSDPLRRFIGQTLTDLRLNYTEETRRARETSDHPDTEPGIGQG